MNQEKSSKVNENGDEEKQNVDYSTMQHNALFVQNCGTDVVSNNATHCNIIEDDTNCDKYAPLIVQLEKRIRELEMENEKYKMLKQDYNSCRKGHHQCDDHEINKKVSQH